MQYLTAAQLQSLSLGLRRIFEENGASEQNPIAPESTCLGRTSRPGIAHGPNELQLAK